MTFPPDQVFCVFDYETYSEAPLKKVGAFEYSVHPSTDILCLSYRIGTHSELRQRKTLAWAPSDGFGHANYGPFIAALVNPKVVLVAHNALFEQVITRNVLGARLLKNHGIVMSIPPTRFLCTAALAASLALPRSLEGAANVLKLPVRKDMEGAKLLKLLCKPRKVTKKNPDTRIIPSAEQLARLKEYCVTDTDAETELLLRAPPLTPTERRVWELDQAINLRGFQVDRLLVQRILGMIEAETTHLDRRVDELTYGLLQSANQRAGVLEWLEGEGVFLPDLQKKTVEDALKDGLAEGDAKEMLEIRLAIAKTSTAKYEAFELRSRHDSRLRDILIYHQASTGRWAGAGVQPQNFPRGTLKNSLKAADMLASGDLEMVRLVYGKPMDVFSSCLRNMIVAPEGKTFDVGDYSAIEARVLFWVAKHEAGIRAFTEGRDLYKELATRIFNTTAERVTDAQRFVGKQATLGCGYSMGHKKFMATCKNLGQEVGEDLARTAVETYRRVHAPVVKSWSNIERAAVAAVENLGKRYTVNRTSWWVKDGFLWCELPSGRRLAYHEPSVNYEPSPWGDPRPVLYHWSVDSLSKKWVKGKTYGGRLVENVVQAISRDVMAAAMLRIDATGHWDLVLSVHDELAGERDEFMPYAPGDKTFKDLMEELPVWAAGCPVKVEAWEGKRYRK